MDRIDEQLTELIARLGSASTLEDSTARVAEFARVTFGADHAGITVIHARGRLETKGATDDVALKVDEVQYRYGQGPCVDAATLRGAVICEDTADDPRWPDFGPGAAALGVRSVLSVDLRGAEGERLGAVNLYGSRPSQFAEDDERFLRAYCDHIGPTLSLTRRLETLSYAVESRTVIGQAQGIVMERFQVDAPTAFAILRRVSQTTNVRVREIAENLVQTGNLPGLPARS